MPRDLFPTTVVGSMPRPAFFRELVDRHLVEGGPEKELHRLIDRSIPYVAAVQEAAGLDIISDGELRRKSYIGVVSDIVTGFEMEKTYVDSFRHGAFVGYTVTGEVRPVSPGLFAREARFLKSWTDREIRIAIPTAFQIADITWKAERSAGAYSSVREFAEALVPVLRQEVIALKDEGVTYVQFDDTSFGRVYDPIAGRMLDDFDERQELAVESFNRTVEGIDGLHKSLHLCGKRPLGPDGQPGFSPLLPSLVEMDLDMVMLELCDPDEADMRMLRELPERMDVGVGCVKAKQNGVDSPEEIVGRVKKALEAVDAGRVFLHPDCGFAPGAYWDVPLDEAYEKLRNEAKAAEILRDEFA